MASNKKTVKAKKVIPPRKGAGAKAPKKRPFRLRVGKTYESEKCGAVSIVAMHGDHYTEIDSDFHGHLWNQDGSPWEPESATAQIFGALVREVKGKK